MSALPVMLDGSNLSALVVGGGSVATRKVAALIEAGASVRVVAPEVSTELEALSAQASTLSLMRGRYASEQLGDALLVIAATNDARLNARIAADARASGRLVNVVDAPELGNFVTPAVHRAGDVVVAVSTGGVPGAAARIRDAIARLIGQSYGAAVRELSTLRRALIDGGRRERWTEASQSLVGTEFCRDVESGEFAARVAEWR
ncbi:MAG TPA: bifunctional precorrin-2 dehydrogenase/sirohydrochlorin ferrochelatase [Gemmatimonadaceae bacterium]|nr:bifunctional precorrin-2 dehydrogenase/sirohydrochlorin ferrochelatase [Gemmatimonadaceae bacterium]